MQLISRGWRREVAEDVCGVVEGIEVYLPFQHAG